MELVVALLVIGVILLVLETVLPGMIAGIVGFGCVVAGVILGYVEFGARTGNFILLGTIVGMIGGFIAWMKIFPSTRVGRAFISQSEVGVIGAEKPELLHQTGAALTTLRPSGTALINGRRVDVVTEGAMIERGAPVKVVAIEGMRVVVRIFPEAKPNPLKT